MDINETFSWGKLLKGFVSIKLLVWVVATLALFFDKLDPVAWVAISTIYMGANVVGDHLARKR